MKSLLAILFVLLMMNSSTAYAAKARAIDDEMDSIFHANHMKRHIGETICHATGNYIKTRSQENKNNVIGHLEQADIFELLAIEDGYALIRVITSHKTSPDSWVGMAGWVNSDYIDCKCSETEYKNVPLPESSSVSSTRLEDYVGTTFVEATVNKLRIRNKPDGQTILGRIGKGDEFVLLAVEDGWAHISVAKVVAAGSNAKKGMTGWVNTEYVQIKKDAFRYPEEGANYDKVIDFYYRAISEKWNDEKLSDAHFELWEFPKDLANSGYAFQDINYDGMEELFVFRDDDAEIGALLAGYTLIDGRAVRLFSSWARSRNYLCNDGSIYNQGSNGAAYSVNYILELINGKLEIREGVLSGDYTEGRETKYGWFLVDEEADFSYAEHTLLSDEEAQERIKFYQSTIVRELEGFTSFAEYEASIR